MSYFTQLKIWDGTNIAAVKAASTPAGATDPALVVAISPNNTLAITQSTSPWVVSNSGTFAVQATLASETTKVIGTIRVLGNIGAIFDGVTGSAAPANAVQIGGSDGTNLRALSTDTTGAILDRPAAPTTAKWSQAAITFNSSGANTIVAGVGGQTIRIMRIFFVNSDAATSTNITMLDSTPTNFSGAFLLQSGGSFNGSPSGEPLYVTAVGKGFQINSSAAVQISGTVWYTIS